MNISITNQNWPRLDALKVRDGVGLIDGGAILRPTKGTPTFPVSVTPVVFFPNYCQRSSLEIELIPELAQFSGVPTHKSNWSPVCDWSGKTCQTEPKEMLLDIFPSSGRNYKMRARLHSFSGMFSNNHGSYGCEPENAENYSNWLEFSDYSGGNAFFAPENWYQELARPNDSKLLKGTTSDELKNVNFPPDNVWYAIQSTTSPPYEIEALFLEVSKDAINVANGEFFIFARSSEPCELTIDIIRTKDIGQREYMNIINGVTVNPTASWIRQKLPLDLRSIVLFYPGYSGSHAGTGDFIYRLQCTSSDAFVFEMDSLVMSRDRMR